MVRSLLLITDSFPPLNNIAAQRFPPMLPVLEANGWQVFVLTKHAKGPLPVRLAETRILRIGRHRQEGLMIAADSPVAGGPRALAAVKAGYRRSGLYLRSCDSSLFNWGRAVQRALPEIRTRLPAVDVVLGTYGPAAALWLARRLAGLYGAPWVADFRDPAALRSDGRPAWAQWLDRRIEQSLLRSAAAVVTCGESWAAALGQLHGRPVHVVYNGWDREHFELASAPGTPEAVHAAGGRPYLYLAGRFYERQMEAVRRLLMAVAETPFAVVVRSLGPVEREAPVRRLVEQLGLADQIRLLPPVPLATVQAEAQAAAANLVLETIDTAEDWARGHLSGKFLQLLPLAPPILFIARADNEAGEVLRRTGKGALCTEVVEIRAQLEQLAAGGSLGGPVAAAAVAEFSKARQGARLLALLESVHGRWSRSTAAPGPGGSPAAPAAPVFDDAPR